MRLVPSPARGQPEVVPRRPREEAPGAIHHVVAQGNAGQAIFFDDTDRITWLRQLCRVTQDSSWECLAYCLMSTHLHLVLLTPQPNLGRGMQRLIGGYAFSFNRRHGRSGHLFLGPYYSRVVAGESHLVSACFYVVLNPVAAGLCAHPSEWRWSSYAATAGDIEDGNVRPDLLLGLIDDDLPNARRRYREMVEQALRDLGPGVRHVPD